jgi:putative transposase
VVSKACVIATGVREDGHREVLGITLGDSEDELFWRTFLTKLKDRGLTGVQLCISDQHAGLVAAIRRCFQGASHQRCRVHFAQNLLATVPKGNQEMVAAVFRTVFAQPTPAEMAAHWDHVRDTFAERFEKAAKLMDDAKDEVLAFSSFPRAHWRQIWSTNPLERLNMELKRRCRVVGIFPNETALVRLAGAVLLDMHEEWIAAERRYFSEGSMAKLYPERDDGDAINAELESGG